MKKIAYWIVLIALISNGCLSSRVASKSSSPKVSKSNAIASDEVAIGEKINEAIMASFYPYTEPKLNGYINRVGKLLTEHAERQDLPYRFTLLYNDKIYAASAPGGFIYLTTGLVYFLDNEAELAAVMAHEIGELQYKDPRLSRARKVLDAVLKGGSMVGPAFGEIGALTVLGMEMVKAVSEARKLTPGQKVNLADGKALHYMVAAGYDPQGMIDVMYKFLNAGKEVAPYFYDYYQSRPINQERMLHISEEFSKLPLAGESFTTNRDIYKESTKGVREIYKQ